VVAVARNHSSGDPFYRDLDYTGHYESCSPTERTERQVGKSKKWSDIFRGKSVSSYKYSGHNSNN